MNKIEIDLTKEQFDIWLDDLRSNRYEQGEGFLYTKEENYCCLGILCTQVISNMDSLYNCELIDDYSINRSKSDLEHVYISEDIQSLLAGLNDGDLRDSYIESVTDTDENFDQIKEWISNRTSSDKRLTFHQIADFIETFFKPNQS